MPFLLVLVLGLGSRLSALGSWLLALGSRFLVKKKVLVWNPGYSGRGRPSEQPATTCAAGIKPSRSEQHQTIPSKPRHQSRPNQCSEVSHTNLVGVVFRGGYALRGGGAPELLANSRARARGSGSSPFWTCRCARAVLCRAVLPLSVCWSVRCLHAF